MITDVFPAVLLWLTAYLRMAQYSTHGDEPRMISENWSYLFLHQPGTHLVGKWFSLYMYNIPVKVSLFLIHKYIYVYTYIYIHIHSKCSMSSIHYIYIMCLHNNILNKSCMECVLTIPPQLNFCLVLTSLQAASTLPWVWGWNPPTICNSYRQTVSWGDGNAHK